MTRADAQLIEQIRQTTQGAARLLCTLARRGKAIEQDAPERNTFLLASVRSHPLYKGGRLAFDMLEIEDVMLEGLALDPMSAREINQLLTADTRRLLEALMRTGSHRPAGAGAADPGRLDSDLSPGAAQDTEVAASPTSSMPRVRLGPRTSPPTMAGEGAAERDAAGPELELRASDYLYDYVVVGLLDVLGEMGGRISMTPRP